MRLGIAFLMLVLGVTAVVGQSKNERPSALHPGPAVGADRTTQGKKRVLAGRRKSVYRSPNVRHTAQYEFYERVEQAAKQRQRLLIEQARHKKSNFGHKRKPRKRPPHKMRFCQECGIRH